MRMRNVIRGLIGFAAAYGAMRFAEASGIEQSWRRIVIVIGVYAVALAMGLWIGLENKER